MGSPRPSTATRSFIAPLNRPKKYGDMVSGSAPASIVMRSSSCSFAISLCRPTKSMIQSLRSSSVGSPGRSHKHGSSRLSCVDCAIATYHIRPCIWLQPHAGARRLTSRFQSKACSSAGETTLEPHHRYWRSFCLPSTHSVSHPAFCDCTESWYGLPVSKSQQIDRRLSWGDSRLRARARQDLR